MARAPYRVVVDEHAKGGIELRGNTRRFFACHGSRKVLAGPSDTGKTFASLVQLHLACLKYPRSQHAMVRKVYNSIAGSCAKTFNRLVAGAEVKVLGSDTPRLYTYPNGSQVWVAGMDDPEKVLSAEYDSIYVNQTEQLTRNDFELLGSRCSGRSAVVRYPQVFGDCNPGGSRHWLRDMVKEGKLEMFHAAHTDNPTLYDAAGNLLAGADARLKVLADMTGVRRKRLYEGVWATAEGAVYDGFDANVHVLVRDARECKRWFLAMDEGYTNPAVVLLVGEDGDGRWHVFKEFYETGRLQEAVVRLAVEWSKGVELVAVDEAAAGLIADLKNAGLPARGGKGRVMDGINKLQNRLKVQGDGRPRLTFDPSCVNCVNEFESYVWKAEKDVPVKEHDHTSDALRYLEDVLAEPTGQFRAATIRLPALEPGRDMTTPGDAGRFTAATRDEFF